MRVPQSLRRGEVSSLGLVRHHHNLHDERAILGRAVAGARVAFVGTSLAEEEQQALVSGFSGTVVGIDEQPTLIVVPDAAAAARLEQRGGPPAWIVDGAELRAMVTAYRATEQSGALALAREKAHRRFLANLPLLRSARRAGSAAEPARPAGRGGGMRTTERIQRARPSEEERALEFLVRDLDTMVRTLRSDDPDCRLYRR